MSATSLPSPQRIDSSSRLPLFTLFGGAAFWLALSSVFALIASLKFHAPAMFAKFAWLSYGRVFPASANLLVYGFCIPAGLGVGLWLIARLGRVEVAQPWLIALGAKLWHVGVLVGMVAIFGGETTGYEWLEMPRHASVILFLAFLLMAMWTFVTYSRGRRTEQAEDLYPSQWFALAALFWFPWIFSTAIMLLQFFPVRGMAQAAVAWWFAGNLVNVWLALAGLAATFYFLPKLVAKPLQSYYLALFTFITLLLFGTFTGIPGHVPLPAWMPSLSAAAGLLFLIPSAAVATMMLATVRGAKTTCAGGPLCFTKFGVWSFALSGVLLALAACPQINRSTDFTWFGDGHNALRIYGFFATTMFAAVYEILPRLAGIEICRNRIRAHFWLNAGGVLLLAFPLVIAGALQGLKLVNASVAFADVVKVSMMPFRLSTVGNVLLLAGNALFFANITLAMLAHYRAQARTAYAAATAELEPAGVKP